MQILNLSASSVFFSAEATQRYGRVWMSEYFTFLLISPLEEQAGSTSAERWALMPTLRDTLSALPPSAKRP